MDCDEMRRARTVKILKKKKSKSTQQENSGEEQDWGF